MKSNVSVAIPTFNGEKYILNTLQSVYEQSYRKFELIIIDDCSTDNTFTLIQASIENIVNKVNLIQNKKNIGYSKNWNNCFRYCKTKYLIILHQDDLLKNEALKILSDYLINNPQNALVGGKEDFIDQDGEILSYQKPSNTMVFSLGEIYEFVSNTKSYIPCSSVMFDIEKIKDFGFFREDVLATDELYWPWILQYFPISIIGESLIYRRAHPAQTEYKDFVKKYDEIIRAGKEQFLIKNYEQRFIKKILLHIILKNKYAFNSLDISIKILINGKHRIIAMRYLFESIKTLPFIILTKRFLRFIYYFIF